MNFTAPRFLKSFYRKEQITGLIITAGAVNALLGGVNAIGSLFILGLLASGGAIFYRWRMIQQTTAKRPELLPPAAEYAELPLVDQWTTGQVPDHQSDRETW